MVESITSEIMEFVEDDDRTLVSKVAEEGGVGLSEWRDLRG